MADFQLRAPDYQKAWAVALSRDLHENAELMRMTDVLTSKLEDQRQGVLDVLHLLPQIMLAVEDRLHETANNHINAIDASSVRAAEEIQGAHTELGKAQADFIAKFTAQQDELKRLRDVNDLQRADIQRAQRELDEAKAGFNSMGLFRRIFIVK